MSKFLIIWILWVTKIYSILTGLNLSQQSSLRWFDLEFKWIVFVLFFFFFFTNVSILILSLFENASSKMQPFLPLWIRIVFLLCIVYKRLVNLKRDSMSPWFRGKHAGLWVWTQLLYYIHFWTNTLGKGMKTFIAPGYGLNSITTVLLQRWIWHWITHKSWYTIKQTNSWFLFYKKKLWFLFTSIIWWCGILRFKV